MKSIDKRTEVELARRFITSVWHQVEDGDDTIYEEIDPEYEYGDTLCDILNNETVLEVLRLGFKAKYGVELNMGGMQDDGKRTS